MEPESTDELVAGVAGCADGPTPRSERRVRYVTNAAKGALTTVTAANAPFAASLMERTRLSLHPIPRTRTERPTPPKRTRPRRTRHTTRTADKTIGGLRLSPRQRRILHRTGIAS